MCLESGCACVNSALSHVAHGRGLENGVMVNEPMEKSEATKMYTSSHITSWVIHGESNSWRVVALPTSMRGGGPRADGAVPVDSPDEPQGTPTKMPSKKYPNDDKGAMLESTTNVTAHAPPSPHIKRGF